MTALTKFKNELSLASFIDKNYKNQITNYFADPQKALEFLSNIRAEVQRNPKLLECDPGSLVNSFITAASLKLMPSGVSGEAYILPYNNKDGMVAQFQLGYQGLVTLFYRAGVQAIHADIVRENDKIELVNGNIQHTVNPLQSVSQRGKAIGAYVVVNYRGQLMGKYMHAEDILAHGKKFSKSYFEYDYKTKKKTENVGKHTPWNEENDPELWMWKKTVLKQAAKLIPKNETIYRAIAEDNKDSILAERLENAKVETNKINMGNLKLLNDKKEKDPDFDHEDSQETTEDTPSVQTGE